MRCYPLAMALISLLFSLAAHAASPLPADFEEGEAGLRRLGRGNFVRASVPLKLYNRDGGYDCSGVIVSDEGHVLTASHCLDSCRFEADGTPSKSKRCVIQIKEQILSFEVLKGNACPIALKEKVEMLRLAGRATDSYPANCQDQDLTDYALLKPALADDLGSYSCLPIAATKPAVGTPVFTMGYPGQSFRAKYQRPGAKDAAGDTLSVSTGLIVDEPTCESRSAALNAFTRFIYGEEESMARLKIQNVVRTIYRHTLQTTVDAVPGSSGGPLINQAGEVVGVASVIDPWVHNTKKECRGATFFQPVADLSGLRCEKRRSAMGEAL